jgi:hypothetical protein
MPGLSEPERACLALAWEAMVAGTNPAVGAVVVDGAGTIVASGRNAVYEPPALVRCRRLPSSAPTRSMALPGRSRS